MRLPLMLGSCRSLVAPRIARRSRANARPVYEHVYSHVEATFINRNICYSSPSPSASACIPGHQVYGWNYTSRTVKFTLALLPPRSPTGQRAGSSPSRTALSCRVLHLDLPPAPHHRAHASAQCRNPSTSLSRSMLTANALGAWVHRGAWVQTGKVPKGQPPRRRDL